MARLAVAMLALLAASAMLLHGCGGSGPAPTPAPVTWDFQELMNCFPGLGADIPPDAAEPATVGQSLEECKELCTNTPQCTAIVFGKPDGACCSQSGSECRLRMNVVESRCYFEEFGYDTYIQSGSSIPAPAPTPAPSVSLPDVPHYDTAWKELITGSTCPPSTPLTPSTRAKVQSDGELTCELSDGVRKFKFPAGIFDIDEQVVVPANTHIEGNANPIDPADKSSEPDPVGQTYFVATAGVTDTNTPYCGNNNNMQQGDAQRLRIGFLLNSNTVVKNFNFQGRDTLRPDDNGSLCGGAVFETPGCVSPGFCQGVGDDWFNEESRTGCHDIAGNPNNLITGDGSGVENVLIDSVRLNGLFLEAFKDNLQAVPSSQIAVWVALTQDGSATKNVRVNNLVSMSNRGDGINFHGNVQDSIAENCHLENTGDDIYAAWGGYGENHSNVVFRNNVGKNPGVLRSYLYGVCVAVYGATQVTVTGTQCYDRAVGEWNSGQAPGGNYGCNWGPYCNSCLAYVHDGYFGAVYPDGNIINIYDNTYMDMSGTPIPEGDRPQVRVDNGNANVPPETSLAMI